MENSDYQKTLKLALSAAGRVLKKRFGRVQARYKGRANIVTLADLESQKTILSIICRRHPGHDYLAEESAVKDTGAEYLWIIDPLDGTTNYAHGYPASCVSIGLLRRGRPYLAGIYDPSRDETFLAEKGKGATLNGRRIRVSKPAKIKESLLITGFPYDRAERSHFYIELYRLFMVKSHDVRRSGSAALDLAWIAAGRADGYWEFNLSPWDVAAGMLLVEEAGGRVSDFSGRPLADPSTFGKQTLATNGRIHKEMLKELGR